MQLFFIINCIIRRKTLSHLLFDYLKQMLTACERANNLDRLLGSLKKSFIKKDINAFYFFNTRDFYQN